MRYVEKIVQPEGPFKINDAAETLLEQYLTEVLTAAESALHPFEQIVEEALRQYHGEPNEPLQSLPIEDAPNVEITLGATTVDALNAQAVSAIFNTAPIVTVREANDKYTEHAKALQDFVDWGVLNEWGLRAAAEHAIFDCIQLGTGVFYIPYEEGIRKTGVRRVMERGPHIKAIAPEDLYLQGGAFPDLEREPFVGIQMYMSKAELMQYSKETLKKRRKKKDDEPVEFDDPRAWDTDKAQQCGAISQVRTAREKYGRTESNKRQDDLYRIFKVWLSFDYDDDGIDEEMIVIFDMTAKKVLWRGFTPHDRRPALKFVFQTVGHMARGLGVMEMMQPYEEEITTGHNDRSLNVKLANLKIFKSRQGEVDEGTLSLWHNRNIQLTNPETDLTEMSISEVHPSAVQHEAATLSLAERRVGVNDLVSPPTNIASSRTPAFTANAFMQQNTNRFTPAYDAIRNACADAVIQCLWRYHERILSEPAGQNFAAQNILKVLGEVAGGLVIELLKMDDFLENVAVTLTAQSAQANKDADRQNLVMLTQLTMPFYEKAIAAAQLAATPGTPPPVIDVLVKVADAAREMLERVVRTFDQVRDPKRIAINISDDLQAAAQSALGGAAQAVGGAGGFTPGAENATMTQDEAPTGSQDQQRASNESE